MRITAQREFGLLSFLIPFEQFSPFQQRATINLMHSNSLILGALSFGKENRAQGGCDGRHIPFIVHEPTMRIEGKRT
jgi:hypothetical protein